MDNESTLLRENARLRKEMARALSALESMELRARAAEKSVGELAKRLRKISDLVRSEEAAAAA